jgi:hypothetical protein
MIGNFSLLHQEIFQNAASIDSIKHVKTTIWKMGEEIQYTSDCPICYSNYNQGFWYPIHMYTKWVTILHVPQKLFRTAIK